MSNRRTQGTEPPNRDPAPPVEYDRAWQRALRLLARQERTEADLRGRLDRAGFDRATCQAVVARLCELSLVDDERFARSWAGRRSGPQAVGKRRLRSELVRKGVDPDTVQRVLSEITGEVEQLSADAVACHLRARLGLNPPQGWQSRVYQALVRRGFGPETSQAALRKVNAEGEPE